MMVKWRKVNEDGINESVGLVLCVSRLVQDIEDGFCLGIIRSVDSSPCTYSHQCYTATSVFEIVRIVDTISQGGTSVRHLFLWSLGLV